MAFKDWSETANENDDADADINWAEGQAPSTVNGSARAMMGKLKVALGHIVSVKDYGASTSASAADNTTAFNAAIAAHSVICVPGGPSAVYDLNALDAISDSKIIYGDGATLRFDTTGDCIPLDAASEAQSRKVRIQGLRFDNVTNTPSSFIKITDFLNTVLEDLHFSDCAATYCIENVKGYGTQVRNCVFSDVTGGGILLRNTSDASNYSFVFGIDNCDLTRISGHGIEVEGANTLKISKTVIESCSGDGIVTSSNASGVSSEIILDACYFEGNTGSDINLGTDGSSYWGRATVIASWFSSATIALGAKSKITLIGCQGTGGSHTTVSGSSAAECYLIGCEPGNFDQSGSFLWSSLTPTSDNIIAYTPTWASSGTQPSIGDGTLSGSYTTIGNIVTVNIKMVGGSTTSFGTGLYNFSLPFAAASSGLGTWGTGNVQNASVANYLARASVASGASVMLATYMDASATPQNVTATAPFTFGQNDSIELTITYVRAQP